MDLQIGTVDHVQQAIIDIALQFGPRLLVAALILTAGHYVGAWVGRLLQRSLHRLHLDPPVAQLMVRIIRVAVLALFAIMALQNLGVELLPLIAGLGVAGAGVALAMQGMLGNVVAGLTIIFTRPFRVGDYISIVGKEGRVEDITLFTTVLSHTDLSRVVIPNRKIVGEILHNHGKVLQLDVRIGIDYRSDIDRALELAAAVLRANPRILAEPAALVGVTALGATGIEIAIRPWVAVPDFLPAQSEVGKAVVESFRGAGIAIPVVPPTLPPQPPLQA